MFRLVAVLCLLGVALSHPLSHIRAKNAQGGDNWAVLVAGSNTWGNYRHQADVCHAYQILKKNGVPDEHIIVMMYDDLAENVENPTKGVIINKPDGPNVYEGIVKDYTKEQVTPEIFLKVLKGNETGVGSGKTLKSGPNDDVFVNFVDHGGPGLIAFPNSFLKAPELIEALETMHAQNMYHQLTFYLEACESGSMFDGLLKSTLGIYATTAADPNHSSYATYYDAKLRTYLGDLYSVNWMENTDEANIQTETLSEQFEIVKKKTNLSEVCKYGDMQFTSESVATFLAAKGKYTPNYDEIISFSQDPNVGAVSSRDVPEAILMHQLDDAETDAEKATISAKLSALYTQRQQIKDTYFKIASAATSSVDAELHMTARPVVKDHACLGPALDAFHAQCYNYGQNELALEYVFSFVSMCESGVSSANIVSAINTVCA